MNRNQILLGVVIAVIVWYCVLPKVGLRELMGDVVDEKGVRKLSMNKCSRDCCKHTQWAVPHMKLGNQIEDGFVTSNLMCNHGKGGGCVCVKQEDFDYLSNRGGNINV